jgi:hypothetical protein
LVVVDSREHHPAADLDVVARPKPPVPDAALLKARQRDYQAMPDARMFYGETLVFDRIVEDEPQPRRE